MFDFESSRLPDLQSGRAFEPFVTAAAALVTMLVIGVSWTVGYPHPWSGLFAGTLTVTAVLSRLFGPRSRRAGFKGAVIAAVTIACALMYFYDSSVTARSAAFLLLIVPCVVDLVAGRRADAANPPL